MPDPDCPAARHGDETAYSAYRCRCPAAREAWRIYRKRGREGRRQLGTVEATGTVRRLRGLAALGWPQAELAARLGMTPSSLGQLGIRRGRVSRTTAAKVTALYDELSMIPGHSKRAADRAARHGWPPPLAWLEGTIDDPRARPASAADRHRGAYVDQVAVQRLRDGDPPARVTRAEYRHAVVEMTGAGETVELIADRLHTSARSITRQRARGAAA
jgi:hypothetical protein